MFEIKRLIISYENVKTDLLLSAGPLLMPWANRSFAHALEGGIFVKPTWNVIMHDVPNFYSPPLSTL